MSGDARFALHTYQVDVDRWSEVAPQVRPLQALLRQYPEQPTAQDLVTDVYNALWKGAPRLRPADTMAPSHAAHHPLLDALLADPSYQELHGLTRNDDWLSAVSTVDLADHLLQQLPPPPDPPDDGSDDPAGDGPSPGPGVDDPNAPPPSATPGGPLPTGVRAAVHRALKQAAKDTGDLVDALAAWGTNPGELQTLPLGDRMAIAKQLQKLDKLRQIAAWIGRIRRTAKGLESRRVEPAHGEIHRVTQGRDLAHALPGELGLWALPSTKRLAQVRYVEGSLQTYGFRGRDRVAMGPLVVTLDLSGSTAGEVEVWEKAVAAALVLEAARTRRPARVTAFSSAMPLERWDFPLGLSSAERFQRLIAMATCWLGGGTDWNQPIRAALDILAEPTWQAADLVLLTDGEAELEPAVQADVLAAEARGLRLLSVLVGRGVSPDTVVDWSTQVLTVEPTREVAATILDTVTTVPAKPPVRRRPAFR